MKKFMFSAVAMIAFVGSSMASTLEVKILKKVAVTRDCMKEARDAQDAALAATGNTSTAIEVGLGTLANCIEDTVATPTKTTKSIE